MTGKDGSIVGDVPASRMKGLTCDEPYLKQFYFERVRPIVEEALRGNDKKDWPLIRLYLDIKNDPPEHLLFISNLLSEYQSSGLRSVPCNGVLRDGRSKLTESPDSG